MKKDELPIIQEAESDKSERSETRLFEMFDEVKDFALAKPNEVKNIELSVFQDAN